MSNQQNDHFEETAREAEEELDALWHQKEMEEAQEAFHKWAHPTPKSWWKGIESDFQKVMKDD